jgi:hypothetical protein
MTVLDSVKSVLNWAPSVTKKIARIETIEARLRDLDTELRIVRDTPVSRPEHAQRTIEWIRRKGTDFLAGPTGPYDTTMGAARLRRPLESWDAPTDPRLDPPDVWPFLCWLLGPHLEAAVPQAVAQLPAPEEVGPPVAERAERSAALGQERTALVREHARLLDEVRADGKVTIEHLPETVTRMEREKRAAEIEAQRARDREWMEEQKRLGLAGTPARPPRGCFRPKRPSPTPNNDDPVGGAAESVPCAQRTEQGLGPV